MGILAPLSPKNLRWKLSKVSKKLSFVRSNGSIPNIMRSPFKFGGGEQRLAIKEIDCYFYVFLWSEPL